jgi:hypothetical protein
MSPDEYDAILESFDFLSKLPSKAMIEALILQFEKTDVKDILHREEILNKLNNYLPSVSEIEYFLYTSAARFGHNPRNLNNDDDGTISSNNDDDSINNIWRNVPNYRSNHRILHNDLNDNWRDVSSISSNNDDNSIDNIWRSVPSIRSNHRLSHNHSNVPSVNLNDYIIDNDLNDNWRDISSVNSNSTSRMPSRLSSSGHGLPKKRRGRPKGSGVIVQIPFKDKIDHEKGIEPSLNYVKMGKYIISLPKLRNDILSLKTINGICVIGLPSYKMSSNLSNIVKSIVGGNIPSFDSINKLSEEEKSYLHKVATKCNIIDKLNIPSPDKDAEEKEYHIFEVMKGEIMAGNDSKELIKKFKLLLIKLAKSNKLPKGQVNEIMNELLQLGY